MGGEGGRRKGEEAKRMENEPAFSGEIMAAVGGGLPGGVTQQNCSQLAIAH